MDWSRTFILGLLLLAGAAFPVLLWRAVRRRDGWRVYGILVSAAALASVGTDMLYPGGLHALSPPLRGLARAALILLTGDLFGLPRRLFRAAPGQAK